ncbi:IS256 family transposase, partial [Glaesserella parasuis]|nr:IS256 family transposase [Glaesserella parasuis]MDP0263015.1 IS256 family transposase [Glaesserella parasuis]
STSSRKSDRTFAKMAGKIPACKDASKKWTMPIQNWKLAMNRFMIDFGDRLDDHR